MKDTAAAVLAKLLAQKPNAGHPVLVMSPASIVKLAADVPSANLSAMTGGIALGVDIVSNGGAQSTDDGATQWIVGLDSMANSIFR
ncbi:MAG TPA: hypothetical protein VH583_01220 [Vicinamibacterales bacterium]